MKTLRPKYVWDYDLPKNWVPKNEYQWLWCLERKINYDDWQGITKEMIIKYFPQLKLKNRLDPGKVLMIEAYLEKYAGIKPTQEDDVESENIGHKSGQ